MAFFPSFLTFAHLLGLSLAVGTATAKLVLLLRSGFDPDFVHVFLKVCRPITKLIILGMVLLTLSGVAWLVRGYPFTPLLVVKLVLVAAVWVLGPVIDNVAEPPFRKLAPAPGEPPSPGFLAARKRYLTLEVAATLIFYVVTVLWVFR